MYEMRTSSLVACMRCSIFYSNTWSCFSWLSHSHEHHFYTGRVQTKLVQFSLLTTLMIWCLCVEPKLCQVWPWESSKRVLWSLTERLSCLCSLWRYLAKTRSRRLYTCLAHYHDTTLSLPKLPYSNMGIHVSYFSVSLIVEFQFS